MTREELVREIQQTVERDGRMDGGGYEVFFTLPPKAADALLDRILAAHDGMSLERCRAIVEGYREAVPAKATNLDPETPRPELEAHLHTMWDRMLEFLPSRREKFMRWLGFVQGALWATEYYEIDELKQHNLTGVVEEPK